MSAFKKHPKTFASITITFFVAAVLVASWLWVCKPPVSGTWVGICVHSLSTDDARLINESGARWVRIDANSNLTEFNASLHSAKAYNLSVLVILDSWMYGKSTVFTLEEWNRSVTYYVSHYADMVDAWEIWNEPNKPSLSIAWFRVEQFKDRL
ncbi:MAG: hypothetical protein NWE98_04280 [Candidatus Bathyarchaeota archaeon]|nr:hypothetical protein [Candidatus Bathyarchaeota archaeon]